MADQTVNLEDLRESFKLFFVDTGYIPGTENHKDFLEDVANHEPGEIVERKPAYSDEGSPGWVDETN